LANALLAGIANKRAVNKLPLINLIPSHQRKRELAKPIATGALTDDAPTHTRARANGLEDACACKYASDDVRINHCV
jgi:hypothetical protein